MNEFGIMLRASRRQSVDRARGGRPLTQERLGEMLGEILGDAGYTGAAISDWERGKSQIHKDQRAVLVALLHALHQCHGLPTPEEANSLLLAGNYRPLDENEARQVFAGSSPVSSTTNESAAGWQLMLLFIGELVFRPSNEIRRLLAGETGSPPPHWPGNLLNLLGRMGQNWSGGRVLRAIFWLFTWLLAWQMLFPLLDWPFAGEEQVRTAVISYMGGVLIVPLLIGSLTHTQDNPFWRQQKMARQWLIRLYTHQGAIVGFHVGYMMIFGVALVWHYFQFDKPSLLLSGAAAAWPIIIGYAAARQIPINLWRAFGRLHLADGGVFFIFALFGFLWGGFFYAYHPILLSPVTGIPLILLAVGSLAGMMAWQEKQTGSSLLPAHFWAGIFSLIIIGYAWQANASPLSLVILSGVLFTTIILMSRNRVHITLRGCAGFLLGSGIVYAANAVHPWLGRVLTIGGGGFWWFWGRRYLWFPMSYWLVVFAGALALWLAQRNEMSESVTAVWFSLFTLAVLLASWKRPSGEAR